MPAGRELLAGVPPDRQRRAERQDLQQLSDDTPPLPVLDVTGGNVAGWTGFLTWVWAEAASDGGAWTLHADSSNVTELAHEQTAPKCFKAAMFRFRCGWELGG